MLCEYGCKGEANHQLKNGKWCCQSNTAKCPAIKKKLGKNHKGYDYSSLSDEIKLRMSGKGQVLMSIDDVFVEGKEWGSGLLRKYVHHYKLLEYKCSDPKCGITEWHGQDITLELDHISGTRSDNRITNLRWLCPNCHSMTPTFRGYNKGNSGKKKITDQELLTALAECSNIRQALQKVGLAAKGGNYERATRLANKAPMVESVDTTDFKIN